MRSLLKVLVFASLLLLPSMVLAATEVGNKICPVSGDKVGEMGEVIHVEHNGKTYNLCCSMCVKDFNKDPDKYTKKAEDEVAAADKK